MGNSDARLAELEASLQNERRERASAEERAVRATERARETDEALRKLQSTVTVLESERGAARDEVALLKDKIAVLEGELVRREQVAHPSGEFRLSIPAKPASVKDLLEGHVDHMLVRIDGLRDLLARASNELSQLHADEVALGKRRARVLADACAVLARTVGEAGVAPPPIPSPALEARLSIAPMVDISEVAELLESLRPPKAPLVEE
jgi:chromosome segregation ATPase